MHDCVGGHGHSVSAYWGWDARTHARVGLLASSLSSLSSPFLLASSLSLGLHIDEHAAQKALKGARSIIMTLCVVWRFKRLYSHQRVCAIVSQGQGTDGTEAESTGS